ncbi:MAG: branched-chain alpha-keto acid dehydrogenase subunit E2 [Methylomarinum sp.]|nr:branched-chain alpha-keto acid dehydrogenase subunit E2 [Methylomarinum sp.]
MSDLIEIKIPDLGGADEVEIVEIMVQPGDAVENEQTLAVMESDKATMDLPASMAGTIQDVIIKVGDKVSQGSLVAMVRPAAAGETVAVEQVEAVVEEKVAEVKPEPVQVAKKPAPTVTEAVVSNSKAHATPSVRAFARELGVDLARISEGSGRKGRILKEDVQAFVKKVMSGTVSQGTGAGIPAIPEVDFSQFGEIDIQPMSKIKRLTGEHMVRVCLNLPMVTQHEEADITEMENFRQAHNSGKPEVKLTGLVFIIKALTAALKQYPQFNSSLSADGQSLVLKKFFNIGIAVETPNGLMVPVIRDADKMSLNQLSEALTDLSAKAREGKLPPAAMQGGTMSISSLGGIGGTAFTPIVNAPEVAILGVTRSKMQPVWNGSEFEPRLMLPLDLTYDHRVVDGAEAARFLVAIAQYLGDIRRLLL